MQLRNEGSSKGAGGKRRAAGAASGQVPGGAGGVCSPGVTHGAWRAPERCEGRRALVRTPPGLPCKGNVWAAAGQGFPRHCVCWSPLVWPGWCRARGELNFCSQRETETHLSQWWGCRGALLGTADHKQRRAKSRCLLTHVMDGCALGVLLSAPKMVVFDLSVTRKRLG